MIKAPLDFETIRKAWAVYPKESKRRVPLVMFLGILGTAFEAFGIGLVIPVMTTMSKATSGNSGSVLQPLFDLLGIRAVGTMVGVAVLSIVMAFIVKNAYQLFYSWYLQKFSNISVQNLSSMLFRSFLKRPYTFHLQKNSSELLNVVQQEVGMTIGIATSTTSLAKELLLGGSVAALMFITEPVAAVSTVTVLILGTVFYTKVSKPKIAALGSRRNQIQAPLTRYLLQGFGGVKDIQVLGRSDDFSTQYERQNLIVQDAELRYSVFKRIAPMWTELLAMSGLTIVVWVMVWQGRPPDRIIPLLGLFVVATWRFVPSINNVLNLINSLAYSKPAVESLYNEFEYIKTQSEIVKTQAVFTDKIEMRNLTFSYANTPAPSLRDVNIVVRKGETVGFIGPSGAGKSTLVDVILGLLPPSSGELLVDGVNMHEHNIEWQSTIGYVAQAIYLTDDSIRRNVAFGIAEKEIDDVALERALKSAQLWDFVQTLPEKDHTIVGERGIRVSGGQRQRIGIARALYHEPQVLVLDEATSSLDMETETEVMSSIRALQGFKTILIVAHRLSTVQHCDRVYKIEDATIVGEGTLEELTKSAS
ncbi:MAG: ABC transporter ATP-binding protein [Acidimicrobiia bacterium]|nr:ABC transporter ATP-binding protein [Actinomycetota bacterium]NCU81073.1 ABC transporter ATP-binding protein [Acidimicrobiia bacterium]